MGIFRTAKPLKNNVGYVGHIKVSCNQRNSMATGCPLYNHSQYIRQSADSEKIDILCISKCTQKTTPRTQLTSFFGVVVNLPFHGSNLPRIWGPSWIRGIHTTSTSSCFSLPGCARGWDESSVSPSKRTSSCRKPRMAPTVSRKLVMNTLCLLVGVGK